MGTKVIRAASAANAFVGNLKRVRMNAGIVATTFNSDSIFRFAEFGFVKADNDNVFI